MPRVTRRRKVGAPPEAVWRLISDPYNLPRWWPRTSRVESVSGGEGDDPTEWTQVLETAEGRGVRADFRCFASAEEERFAWEQRLSGTPFERHLRRFLVDIRVDGADGGTQVSISSEQRLRGLSRLGSVLMRRAQGAILEEALSGLERAVT